MLKNWKVSIVKLSVFCKFLYLLIGIPKQSQQDVFLEIQFLI